ncbi:MAG: cyclic nucleotide-binding domain-containing protein, partial [Gammaproteobacteria bacterium]
MATVADFTTLLECLSARLPSLRGALLALGPEELELMDLRAGEVLLRKGETARGLYVVVTGRLAATANREDGSQLTLSELCAGDIAGEMAILAGGGVYSATVSAIQDSALIKVPREAFERIAESCPEVVREMADGIRRKLARDQLTIGLPRLFGSLDDTMLHFVESRVEWIQLRAGQKLFSAGDKGEDLYFVLGGRLRAVSADGRVLSEMARGESIGEIAILTGEPRTATVMAVRDSELVRVSRRAFDEIVEKYPQVMHTIARIVVRRLRAKERSSAEKSSAECIAILPAGRGAPAVDFTGHLVRALESIGPTLHLSARYVDHLFNRTGIAEAGDGDVAAIRLGTWLDEQESKYRFLVYEANANASAWTQRCLRQADEVVLVAEAATDPTPAE